MTSANGQVSLSTVHVSKFDKLHKDSMPSTAAWSDLLLMTRLNVGGCVLRSWPAHQGAGFGLKPQTSAYEHASRCPCISLMHADAVQVALLVVYTLLATLLLGRATANPGENDQPGQLPMPQIRMAAQQQPTREGEIARVVVRTASAATQRPGPLVTVPQRVLLMGLCCVEVYASFVHPHAAQGKYPFAPLLLISVYCAACMSLVWTFMDWPFAAAHNTTLKTD